MTLLPCYDRCKEGLRTKGIRCLDCIQPQCPLCRDAFSPKDIRKLRVDSDDAVSSSTASVAPPQVVDTHVQRLLDAMANTACGSTSIEETERVIDQCRVYHDAQPDSLVRDVPKSASTTNWAFLLYIYIYIAYPSWRQLPPPVRLVGSTDKVALAGGSAI